MAEIRQGQELVPEATLAALVAEAQAAWPDLKVPAGEFTRQLATRLAAAKGEVRAADLYLAFGCALGDRRALARFDELHLQPLQRTLRPRELADEVVQALRARLLVAPPGRVAQIAEYSGRGPLGHWVRVAAQRAVQKLREGERRTLPHAGVEDALADPELQFVKQAQRPQFTAAFSAALSALPVRERTLLRLHYAEGVSADALGAMLGVHRATATRWLGSARQALLDDLRRRLADELRLSHAEADSMVRLLRSQLEVSLRGALAPERR